MKLLSRTLLGVLLLHATAQNTAWSTTASIGIETKSPAAPLEFFLPVKTYGYLTMQPIKRPSMSVQAKTRLVRWALADC